MDKSTTTNIVLLETNEEVLLWSVSRLPLASIKNKYVVHQSKEGLKGHIQLDAYSFRLTMDAFYDFEAVLAVSSIYDYHYRNTYDV